MEAPEVIQSLIGFIVLILGWNIRMLFSKVADSEKKIEEQQKLIYSEFKESHSKYEASNERTNNKIDGLATSIREEMQKTNTLILSLIEKK